MNQVDRTRLRTYISRFTWFWLGQMLLPFGAAALVSLATAFIMLQISMLIALIIGVGSLGAAALVTPLAVRSNISRRRASGTGIVAGAAANVASVVVLAVSASFMEASSQNQSAQSIASILLAVISHVAVAAAVSALLYTFAARRNRSSNNG